MPTFSWPGRRDASEDAALAALLAGLPTDLPPELQPAADVLAALRARPTADEFAGESIALAEYRGRIGASAPSRHGASRRGDRHRHASGRPRRAVLASLLSARAAVATAAVALAIGGVATAAYAGALPSRAQGIAHDWIGAPAARKGAHPTAASSPAASRPAGSAPCAAYSWARAHGTAAQKAAAYSTLLKAVGGAGKVAGYCRSAGPTRVHDLPSGCRPSPATSWSLGPLPSRSQVPQPSRSVWPKASWAPRPPRTGDAPCTPQRQPTLSPHWYDKSFPALNRKAFPRHVHVGKPNPPAGLPTPPSGLPTPTPRLRRSTTAPRRR